jgi:membrane protein required for colicin V production
MNYLDLILAVPLIWAIYQGFTKGLIFSAASLLALILGVIGAIHFSGITSVFVDSWLHPEDRYLKLISFSLTFVIIVIAVHLLAFFIDKIIKAVALGIINRLAGIIFNLIKMAFILSVVLSLINYINRFSGFIEEKEIEESILYRPVSSFAPAIFPYLRFEDLKEKYQGWKEEESLTSEV